MPLITVSDAGLRENIARFQAQLKCRDKGDDTIELLDVARIDLYAINGIRRQIELLTKERDIKELPRYSTVHSDSESTSTLALPSSVYPNDLLSEELVANIHHYFSRAVQICIEKGNIHIESEEPALSASILKVAIADLFDVKALSETTIQVPDNVSQKINQLRYPVVVKRHVLLQQMGVSLNDDEISEALHAFGYTQVQISEDRISADMPFFRVDITSQSDVIEDIFLYFIDRTHSSDTLKMSSYSQGTHKKFYNTFELKERLSLLGYKEVKLPSLLRRGHIKDPYSIGPTAIDKKGKPNLVLRKSLFHSLLNFECGRQHIKFPHKIFEVGSVSGIERSNTHLGVISADQGIDVNDIFSVLHHTLATSYGQDISLTHGDDDRLEQGGLRVISADKTIGILGIISEEFAKKYKQRIRTAFVEVSLPRSVS